jgi:hypothetical protein
MRLILLLCFCVAGNAAFSQDLTGIWRGNFRQANAEHFPDTSFFDDRYKFETQILQDNKIFTGVTYSYQSTVFYGKASCNGSISTKSKKVILEESRLMEVRSRSGGACLMTCFLTYSKVGNEEFLEGNYSSINADDSTSCGKGTVFLRKVPTSDFYKESFLEKQKPKAPLVKAKPKTKKPDGPTKIGTAKPEDKPVAAVPRTPVKKTPPAPPPVKKSPPVVKTTPNTPRPKRNINVQKVPEDSLIGKLDRNSPAMDLPRVLTTRKNALVKTITTSSNHITLRIYDNGTIDNDTVSVYLDKRLVISKQRLTDKAIELDITLNQKTALHELVMVAENLGEIPPNTSLMVVDTGTEEVEVRITSTEQQNAMVLFKYVPGNN